MAGIEGFEPPMADSESAALPLGDIPVLPQEYREVLWKFKF